MFLECVVLYLVKPAQRKSMSKNDNYKVKLLFYLCKLASPLACPAHFAQDSLFVLSAHVVVHALNTGPN